MWTFDIADPTHRINTEPNGIYGESNRCEFKLILTPINSFLHWNKFVLSLVLIK